MGYEKKLKKRLYLAISYVIIGVVLSLLCAGGIIQNEFFSTFGIVFVVMGVARIRQYRRITKDEESIRRQRVAETDERNLAIWGEAYRMAVHIYVILIGAAVIVLEIIDQHDIAQILAISMCVLVLICWISCWVVHKKY